MTILAAEAAPAARAASSGASVARGGSSGAVAGAAPAGAPAASQNGGSKPSGRGRGRDLLSEAPGAAQSPYRYRGDPRGPGRTYHRIVMAEFIVTVALIGLSPVLASRRAGVAGAAETTGASLVGPLMRLTAAAVVFFPLALMSTGRRSGRVAAAFGGLITLGTALNATDMFTAVAHFFEGKSGAEAEAAGGSVIGSDTESADLSGGGDVGASAADIGKLFPKIRPPVEPTPTGKPQIPPIGEF